MQSVRVRQAKTTLSAKTTELCSYNEYDIKNFVARLYFFAVLFNSDDGRPKPESWFLPGQLRRTLLPKERYGNSLSGCGSNTQPSNWEADTTTELLLARVFVFQKQWGMTYFSAKERFVNTRLNSKTFVLKPAWT